MSKVHKTLANWPFGGVCPRMGFENGIMFNREIRMMP